MNELGVGADALSSVLSHQGAAYGSLLELASREEQAITDGDVGTLTAIVDDQRQLLDVLRALETERMTALTAIAAATGVQLDALTLTGIALMLDREAGEALTASGLTLRAQAEALNRANDRNAQLLENSREIVDRWIQYLRTIVSGALMYTAEGEPEEASGYRVLDRSA
ncbi:MAG: flagellar protein FlgN [Dehalococcoidia bacterium]